MIELEKPKERCMNRHDRQGLLPLLALLALLASLVLLALAKFPGRVRVLGARAKRIQSDDEKVNRRPTDTAP